MSEVSKDKKLISLNEFISGSIAGIVQVLLGQPLDIVKVRMQTQTQGNTNQSPLECAKSILKNEGPMGFYKGTLSPLIGVSFCVAVQFGSNGSAKKFFENRNKGKKSLSASQNILCGAFAGMMNSFVQGPVELLRIKMQVQGKEGVPKYTGSLDCLKKIYSQFGIAGLYQGLSSTLLREIPGFSVYFGIYEFMMNSSEQKYGDRKNIPKLNICGYGALSGFSLWVISFPCDVVKSCMQADDIQNRKYPNIMSTIRTIYSQKGFGGFFKGLTPCLIRAPPINAATFFTFEYVHEMLKANK